jgi:putative membrane protein
LFFLDAVKRPRGTLLSAVASRSFFDDAAKTAVRDAIRRIELQTSAEVVVAVRRQAGVSYLDVELLVGAFLSFVSLLLLLFLEQEFAMAWIPFDVAVAFVIGFVACRTVAPLRRLLVPKRRRQEEASRAAAALFHQLGIGKTTERNGILVVFAAFERQVAVQADVGVDASSLKTCVESLVRSVDRASPSFEEFIGALESLGPMLAQTMPRREDDVNELSDEVA